VAVAALTPVSIDPMAQDNAVCSDSTRRYFAFNLPSATYWESRSAIGLCGVMGYAEITPTRANLIASVAAPLPSNITLDIIGLLFSFFYLLPTVYHENSRYQFDRRGLIHQTQRVNCPAGLDKSSPYNRME
jgi:hypothetical protein